MKKICATLLVGMLLVGSTTLVWAQEGSALQEGQQLIQNRLEKAQELKEERTAKRQERFQNLKEFGPELDRLNALERERLTQKIEINQARQDLRNAFVAAVEAGDTEALAQAKEKRQELKALNEGIRDLHGQAATERQEFRSDLKNGSTEEARGHLNKLSEIKETINAKLKEKVSLLKSIIGILS